MMQQIVIPPRLIDEIFQINDDVLKENEKQLFFLKSCLYYLKEGVDAEQVINMAMVDYLVEL